MEIHGFRLPKIGARIIKSAAGVAVCMLLYMLRGESGMPFYSALAVLWCMQPYTDTTKNMAKQRTIGTITGAAHGLVFLLIFMRFPEAGAAIKYLAASAMIIPVIYTTVLMKKKNASFFSCVVFLSIAISHSSDANPYIFVLNRVIDTFIGIAVGVAVNIVHIPKKHNGNILYVSGIDDVLVSGGEPMSAYSKVELNRLIAAGAKFTVSTVRTPAAILELMQGINFVLPVIAMDGAVLFDTASNTYIEAVPLSKETADKCERIILKEGLHCFVNSLFDNTLIIYYGEFCNEAEQDLFNRLRKSPYRNYTHSSFRSGMRGAEEIIYLMVLATDGDIERLREALFAEELDWETRMTFTPAQEYPGYTYLKIYSKEASKQKMLELLTSRSGAEKAVTFGSVDGDYDVIVDGSGGDAAVRTLKKLYEKKN